MIEVSATRENGWPKGLQHHRKGLHDLHASRLAPRGRRDASVAAARLGARAEQFEATKPPLKKRASQIERATAERARRLQIRADVQSQISSQIPQDAAAASAAASAASAAQDAEAAHLRAAEQAAAATKLVAAQRGRAVRAAAATRQQAATKLEAAARGRASRAGATRGARAAAAGEARAAAAADDADAAEGALRVLRAALASGSESLLGMFTRHDTDQSGTIDEGELVGLLDSIGLRYNDAQAHRLFASLDLDGSGAIEFVELKRMVSVGAAQAKLDVLSANRIAAAHRAKRDSIARRLSADSHTPEAAAAISARRREAEAAAAAAARQAEAAAAARALVRDEEMHARQGARRARSLRSAVAPRAAHRRDGE